MSDSAGSIIWNSRVVLVATVAGIDVSCSAAV